MSEETPLTPKQIRGSRAARNLRAVKLEQSPLCEECSREKPREVHHRTPLNRGGSATDIDNLMALCSGCHRAYTRRERPLQLRMLQNVENYRSPAQLRRLWADRKDDGV